MQWFSIILSVLMAGILIAIIYFTSSAAVDAKHKKLQDAERKSRTGAIIAGISLALFVIITMYHFQISS